MFCYGDLRASLSNVNMPSRSYSVGGMCAVMFAARKWTDRLAYGRRGSQSVSLLST